MKRLLLTLFLTLLLLLAATGAVFGASYVTESYHVDVEVNRDNSWIVTETIQMNFTAPSHGIYRYIPYQGTIYYNLNGEETENPYKLKISDLDIPDHSYDVSDQNGCLVIKIGDPELTIEGPQKYVITYRVTSHDDRVAALDQFYWELLSTDWNTPISNAEFTIRMPGPIDKDQVEFIAGSYGATAIDEVDFAISDNLISAKLNRTLAHGEGVTLRILLPEGYFAGERNNEWLFGLIIVLIAIAPLTAGLLWYFFGRDPKVVRTVEFAPPQGTDAAQLGYIIDGIIDSKDMVAMVISFANQGCLSIHEDGLGVFTLQKTGDLPPTAKDYEQTLFSGLFRDGDTVDLEMLKEDFQLSMNKAKKQLEEQFTRNKEDRLFTQSSVGARVAAIALMMLPLVAVTFLGSIYSYLELSVSLITMVFLLGAVGCFVAFVHIYDKRYSLSAAKKTLQRIVA
ncbi:MAG: DUF2207 domain-containing protein, partial [Eubacteriales bacterium]|nr:DUF2207 domain-containing protein [Eubacteriales bacterium]